MEIDKKVQESSPYFPLAVLRAALQLTERLELRLLINMTVEYSLEKSVLKYSLAFFYLKQDKPNQENVLNWMCTNLLRMVAMLHTPRVQMENNVYFDDTSPPHWQFFYHIRVVSSSRRSLAFSKAVTLASCTTCA